jgi:hypothetical protein
MDEHRDEVRVEPVGPKGVSRAVPIVTFLVGIFLGAALVKPWDLLFPPGPPPIDRGSPVVAAASPTVGPTPAPSGPSAPSGPAECAFAGGWRIFALGQADRLGGDGSTTGGAEPSGGGSDFSDIGNPLRRWLEVVPVTSASGPEDARIPYVTIVSSRITGVGYCPPPGGTDGPPAGVDFSAWWLDGAGTATPLPLQPVTAKGSVDVEVHIGIRDVLAGGRWPAGRYVFEVASSGGDYGRWFGLEIRTPPGPPSNG